MLLRVDYNIAAKNDGGLVDDWRIRASLPTIKRLLEAGARIGILTHRGRPQGRVIPELSTAPTAKALAELLGQAVEFVPDCVGRVAEQAMAKLAPGKVCLFENTRFHLGEQMNQQMFLQKLQVLGDVFVNDAFATAHRAHASTSGLGATMPVSVIGELMVRELEWLRRATEEPERPFLLVIGGADVAPRLDLIGKILTRVDTLMLGGTVGLTFLAGRDVSLGQSQIEHSCVEAARDLLAEAGVVGCRLHLPRDVVVARKQAVATPIGISDVHQVKDDEVASDLGPETLATWSRLLEEAKTVLWIGSLGAYETPGYRAGTLKLAEILTTKNGFSLLAGNGLVATLADGGLRERLPAVSTGVGALLAALQGHSLPSLSVLGLRQGKAWDGAERRRG